MKFKQLSLPLFICLASSTPLEAQSVTTDNWYMSPGIIGTFVLITIVLFIAVIILPRQVKLYKSSF
jgi:cytochrome c oxidase cbb3-type subunit I